MHPLWFLEIYQSTEQWPQKRQGMLRLRIPKDPQTNLTWQVQCLYF